MLRFDKATYLSLLFKSILYKILSDYLLLIMQGLLVVFEAFV